MTPILTPKRDQRRMTLADLPACCQNKRNITQVWLNYDLRVTTCNECGHVYRRLFAEPGSLGATIGAR